MVTVFILLHAMAAGLKRSSANTGDPRNIMIVRKGSTAESSSVVMREQFKMIQYLPQTVGFFLLRFREPALERPFRMWLYPLPGIVSILGWIYVLVTAAPRSLIFASAVLTVGSAAYFLRARKRREWPFSGGHR